MSKLSKAWFMLGKMRSDLRRMKAPGYELAEDMNGAILREYYFVFAEQSVAAGKSQALIKKFDDNGIPINKTYVDVVDKDYVYFPISIGQMGLSVWHTYLNTKSDEDLSRFLKFVDWFSEHGEYTQELGLRWMTDVALPAYHNPGPWQSAFSQSRGISILLRGYQVTGEKKYADQAREALKSFEISVQEGGVTSFTPWGPFYEEYTSEVPTLVLNGMIFALCGVYDFVRVFPEEASAKRIFDEGISTVESILPEFDMGFWSKYNLCEADWYPEVDPSTILYQKLHVTQLNMLHRLTGKEVFRKYATLFEGQLKTTNVLKMYPIKYKALKKIGRL